MLYQIAMQAELNKYFPNDTSNIILDIHYRTMFYESIDQMKMIMSCYLRPLGSISHFMLIMIEGDKEQRKMIPSFVLGGQCCYIIYCSIKIYNFHVKFYFF